MNRIPAKQTHTTKPPKTKTKTAKKRQPPGAEHTEHDTPTENRQNPTKQRKHQGSSKPAKTQKKQ